MGDDFGEFADGKLAPPPRDVGGNAFDANSLNECAGHWNTVQLRPAIQGSLNRRFDRELNAAARMKAGRERTFALAALGWAFNHMAKPDKTEGRRAALRSEVNAIKIGPVGTAIAGETTALQTAVELGMPSATRELLAAGADPNPRGKYESMLLLHRAIQGRHAGIVEQLLKAGARPNEANLNDETADPFARLNRALMRGMYWGLAAKFVTAPALQFAVELGQAESAKLLLDYGADKHVTDEMRRTPLHTAAERGDVAVVNALLQSKVNLEILDTHELTALNLALRQVVSENWDAPEHMDVVSALLKSGANPNAPDPQYGTPLHLAAEWGDVELAKQLLEAGANVNVEHFTKTAPGAGNGFTPLHLAVQNPPRYAGPELMMKLLLEHGASPNAMDSSGSTVLHAAVKNNSVSSVDVLLQFNVDTNLKDGKGRTARQLAVELGHDAVVNALDAKGQGVAATPQRPTTRRMQGETSQHVASENMMDSVAELAHKRPRIDTQSSPQPRMITRSATRGMAGEPQRHDVSENMTDSVAEPAHKRPRIDTQSSPQPRITTRSTSSRSRGGR